MKKKVNKIIYIFIIVAIILLLISNITMAGIADDEVKGELTGIYNIFGEDDQFNTKAGDVLGLVQYIGYAVAVIMAVYIGIKFIIASPEGKADVKKQLIPFTIGIVLLFLGSTIIGVVHDLNLFQ